MNKGMLGHLALPFVDLHKKKTTVQQPRRPVHDRDIVTALTMEDSIRRPPRQLNILVLGGSYAGLSTVHQLLTNLLPDLRTSDMGNFHYKVYLVSPSTHLYWNICAPRAIISTALLPLHAAFHELAPGLRRYPRTDFQFILGTATHLDTRACSVTIDCRAAPSTLADPDPDDAAGYAYAYTEQMRLDYHALVIATGSTAHSPLLSLRGPHTATVAALTDFHARLATAETVLVAGAGCTGVEVAGQLAHFCNHASSSDASATAAARPTNLWSALTRKPVVNPNAKKIVLVTRSTRLLPHLQPRVGERAERQLRNMGVRIITGVEVSASTVDDATGRTTLHLTNGTTLGGDLYVPCTGVTANSYLAGPPGGPLVRPDGAIRTVGGPDASTLRIAVPPALLPEARPEEHRGRAAARVYAIGDVADYSHKRVMDVTYALPVLMRNLGNDLRAHQLQVGNPYGGNAEAIEELRTSDARYQRDDRDNQLVPIGWKSPGGVGVLNGVSIPGALVWAMKGKHYKVDEARKLLEKGL